MSVVVFKKRGGGGGAPSSLRKRDVDDTEAGFQQYANPDEGSLQPQPQPQSQPQRAKGTGVLGGTTSRGDARVQGVALLYESNKDAAPVAQAGDATHTSEVDTATDRDARAILERTVQSKAEGSKTAAGGGEGKAYLGQAAYEKSFVKTDVATAVGASKATGTHGPLRAPSFVRTTTRFDYQPDICKDYKETGFCGYGDSCKFLHDRGDYKSGWQQEKEWDEQQAKKRKRLEEAREELVVDEDGEGEDGNEEARKAADDLPHACLLCRGPFKNPVVTMCGHYFCSACIMEAHKTSQKCPAVNCQKNTFGVFNKAHKLLKGGGGGEPAAPVAAKRPSAGKWEEV